MTESLLQISLHKITMTFSQELIWRGKTCYTIIVVSGLILKMRSEYMRFLRNDADFIVFSLGYTSYQADHEAAEHCVCHRGPLTKDFEKWLSLYAD